MGNKLFVQLGGLNLSDCLSYGEPHLIQIVARHDS
jgi:hypothetical protein